MDIDIFLQHYIVCALWSSNDQSDEPLDANYSAADLTDEAVESMRDDCESFVERAGELLDGITVEQAGHDFWLTRNGHGAGFWDRGHGLQGERLTELCKDFGDSHLEVGDDGKIYIL